MNAHEVRELRGIAELAALVDLERRIWGADVLPTPPELLRAVQDEGGLVAGAFTPRRELVAFVFGFPAAEHGVQHSHSLGVTPEHRAAGLGARLKWFQRDWCLQRAVHTVRWTYDPLKLPNARLNIGKLGATARTYHENYYGAMGGIDAGAPSDRLLVEWRLAAPEVLARLAGAVPPPDDAPEVRLDQGAGGLAGAPERFKVRLPVDFAEHGGLDASSALRWRRQSREVFQGAFARGYAIRGFFPDPPAYLFSKAGERW